MTLKMDTKMRICLIAILIVIIADVLNGGYTSTVTRTSTTTRTYTTTSTTTRTSTSTTTVTRLCKRSALPYIGNAEVDKFVSCVLENGQRCERGQAVSMCSVPPCLESSFPTNCKCN